MNELLRTSMAASFPASAVQSPCAVLTLADYMEKYSEGSGSASKPPANVFFTRQKYDLGSEEALPKLKPVCFCNTILNPNDPTTRCRNCGVYLHSKCLEDNKDKPCPVCNTMNNEPQPLASTKRTQPENGAAPTESPTHENVSAL